MSSDPLPTGVAAVDNAVVWAVAVTAIAAGLALLVRLLRAVRRMARTIEDVADDWHGEPGRPGVAPRPGVMERLCRIETRLERLEGGPRGGSKGGRSSIRAVP